MRRGLKIRSSQSVGNVAAMAKAGIALQSNSLVTEKNKIKKAKLNKIANIT
jgi:hypothetical protein